MRWYHVFIFPKYFSNLEKNIKEKKDTCEVNQLDIISKQKVIAETLEDYKRELELIKGQISYTQKYFSTTIEKNEIEKEDVESVEIDENYRIPIVDNIKIKFEGEDDSKARSLNIYGQGQSSVQKTDKRRTKNRR
ncbi:MAG: hypothetical protein PHE73_08880 [Sulfurovaceae bacterium]|nr:hypothetical protein [Sulfurovaceae bacterium]